MHRFLLGPKQISIKMIIQGQNRSCMRYHSRSEETHSLISPRVRRAELRLGEGFPTKRSRHLRLDSATRMGDKFQVSLSVESISENRFVQEQFRAEVSTGGHSTVEAFSFKPEQPTRVVKCIRPLHHKLK